ncbi:MAG: hypothetical protein HY769_02445 [Candidatus Stahlbacteria bacterium]|nr:hypothetical protein [Candidatus Stahlbacteria bacterium]
MDRMIDKRIEWGALLFLFFLPVIPVIAYLSFLFLLVLCIRRLNFRRFPFYVYAFLGAIILSCIFSTHKLLSLGALAIFLCYFLSYFIFSTINLSRANTAIILSGILLTAGNDCYIYSHNTSFGS